MNRLFSSCPKPLFQSEATCEVIDVEMIFNSHANQTHFNKKGFALSPWFVSERFWNSEMSY